MWAAAQPDSAISGCSQSCSHLRQNQLLVQLCNQPCILWLGSFLTPRAVFTFQGNALYKALMPCSLSSAEAGLSGQHLTYRVGPSKVLSSPYERQAFFLFPGFLGTLTLLHKTRLSLSLSSLYWDVIDFQSVSFLPANFFLFAQQPELQKVYPFYCRRAEFCPRWWTAWRAREEIKGQWSSCSYPSRLLTLILSQPHFIAWQVWYEMLCFLTSQRRCAGSAILNHQISFALLQMLAWMSGGRGRLVSLGYLSVYSQSESLQGWHGLQQ